MTWRSFIPTLRTLGTLALPIVFAAPFRAQMHKVEAPQQVTRALSVYEWTGALPKPTAARLVPVSLFVNGHFEDAGVYLARPVPFAIETGDIYSIEKAGRGLGTLDVDFARNIVTRRSASDDDPVGVWYGYGRFVPPAAVVAKSNLKPSAHPSTVVASNDDSDDTPHFVTRQPHNSSTSGGTTTPSGADTSGSAGPGSAGSGSASSSSGSTPASGSGNTPASSAGAPAANPAPDDDPDRPTLRHRDPADDSKRQKSSRNTGFVTPPSDSLNDDPDRPRLRRGVSPEDAMAAQLSGLPADLHQDVAVSDAANREAHLFVREWATASERAETLAGLELAARPRIANYLLTNQLTAGPSAPPDSSTGPETQTTNQATSQSAINTSKPTLKPTPKPTNTPTSTTSRPATAAAAARRARAAKTAAPALALSNEQLEGYTLSYGGLPTFIYTVETPVTAGGPVYLTMVAQRLPAGELQVALSSITDAAHLNRTPWMRPVDVVDADASHRASLLFELRAQSSRQFALYRLITAQAEQTFITGLIE